MHHALLAFRAHREAAFLEYLEHPRVARQHFRVQLREPGLTSDPGKVLHQQRADALPLVRIVHGEGDLGGSGLRDDVARPADDERASVLLEHVPPTRRGS